MKKITLAVASGLLAMAFLIVANAHIAYAAGKAKVDCDAVMQALNSGKKPKEVASDLKIPVRRVYYCRSKAKRAAKAAAKETPPAAPAAAAPAPAPAPAAPAPAAPVPAAPAPAKP